MSTFCMGYYLGVLAAVLIPALIFWFAGRWGFFGVLIRIVCVIVVLLRVFTWLGHPPTCA